MNFTVVWTAPAESDLADIWLNALDRQAIVKATTSVDLLLKTDPLDCGESRAGNLRIAFRDPLGIHFEVLPNDRLVYVLAVWRIDRK